MTEAAGRELPMASKGNWLEVGGICLLFIALSIVGIIWDIASGLITSGIDGIMLASICLMTAGIFAIMLLVVLHSAGMLPKFEKESGKAKAETASAPAKSAAPAATASVAAKPPAPAAAAPPSSASSASAPAPKPAATPPTTQGK